MSYIDQTERKNPASIAAVVGVHLAVGYAILGLGYTVIHEPRTPTTVVQVPTEPPPPPPIDKQPPQHIKQAVTDPVQTPPDQLVAPPPIIQPPFIDSGVVARTDGGGDLQIAPPPPIQPSKASDAIPGKDRLRWITTDDYPTTLLRQEVQGVVVISVTIGADGHVRSCLVTQSSGNRQLDDTTCRLYSQRAHFTPARDADGNPTSAQRTDRYRWQIPNE